MAVEHKKSGGSVWLPDDIFFSILSYLPAKPVARFRDTSVSRSWRAMLSSAPFVQLHLRRANRPGQLKVFFHTGSPVDDDLPVEHFFYTWQQHGGPAKKLMHHGFVGAFACLITKPLHGLVLWHSYGGFFVLNPCTNALLALPNTKYPLRNNRYMYWSYGLGYCLATGEYKVVRLFSSPCDREAAATCCEVFVLDAPTCWRPTAQQPRADNTVKVKVKDPPVFLNGLFYFLFRDGSRHHLGPPPLPVANLALDHELNLTELDGCLCAYYGESCSRSYVLWLLRDGDHEAAQWEQL
uniref:F-box associated beta-propeller type 3 domain-containing protein n=1 Tax=Oryza punctata TaxID=4537 RepID=A0A0E0M8X5_ORYPU